MLNNNAIMGRAMKCSQCNDTDDVEKDDDDTGVNGVIK